MKTLSLLMSATVLLCGCVWHRSPPAPEPARGPARDTLFGVDRARGDSASANPAQGVLANFDPRVIYLRGGVPIAQGRDIAQRVLSTTRANDGRINWEPLGGGVSDDLLSAYTYGIVARHADGPRPAFGRYMAYWERVRGAPWRIVAYADLNAPDVPAESLTGWPSLDPEPTLAKPLAQARARLRSADSAFSDLSYRMGMSYAFGATIADDGVVFGAPELRIGPRAVREGFKDLSGSMSLTWKPVYVGVAGSRDLGYTIGEYVTTGRGPSGAAVQRFGKYLTIWRRDKNTWHFVADGGNASPSP